MERKLATIARIEKIESIKGADSIEVATIRGWNVVIKKNEFKEGDLCVYCEIDSVLPEKPEFEFLRKVNFRIKTIKLRGQISQGIVFPLSILPKNIEIKEGLDVTDVLGIKKYEPKIDIKLKLQGDIKGAFPSHSIKTDEERIQNLSKEFNELKKFDYIITEKLDGTSITCYLKDGEFGVCSRNFELKFSENNLYWNAVIKMGIEEKMRKFSKENGNLNFNLQGELVGENIQGNKYKLKGNTIYFFRAFDINNFEFFKFNEFLNIINCIGLETVPILGQIRLPETIDDILLLSEGKSKLNQNVEREGLVFVALTDHTHRKSFKAISNKFLIKNDE